MTTKIAVSEIFGPTFQGEGLSQGRPCVFLRLAGCNLRCGVNDATWKCDTPYTWDWRGEIGPRQSVREQVKFMTPDEIDNRLCELMTPSIKMLVISGGEPMLQVERLIEAIEPMRATDALTWVEIETNGTVYMPQPVWWIDQYNVSPKLANSGNSLSSRYNERALDFYRSQGAQFKFVVQSAADLDEIDRLVETVDIRPDHVWCMPATHPDEPTTHQHTLLAALAPYVLERGYNITSRLHIQIWGHKRGV